MTDKPKPLADAELAEIRKRADAATEGPWLQDAGRPHSIYASDGTFIGGVLCNTNESDVPFIAFARTDVPRLCDALTEARAVIRAFRLDKLARRALSGKVGLMTPDMKETDPHGILRALGESEE